jgi:hypothetical protein
VEDGIIIEPEIMAQDVDENSLLSRHSYCRCSSVKTS